MNPPSVVEGPLAPGQTFAPAPKAAPAAPISAPGQPLGPKIQQAMQAGYSSQDIVAHLRDSAASGGKVQQALDAGYSPDDIVQHLSTAQSDPFATMEVPQGAPSGTTAPSAPQAPQSLLQKASNFFTGSLDSFSNGLINDAAGVAKFITPQAAEPYISQMQRGAESAPASYQAADQSAEGKAGAVVGNIEKTALETVPGLLIPGSTSGSAVTKLLSAIGTGGGLGFVQGGAQSANDGSNKVQQLKDATKTGAISGLLSGGLEGGNQIAESLSQPLRDLIGKTTPGQIYGNPSKDVVAGILGKSSDAAGDYHTLMNKAATTTPQVNTENIVNDAKSVLSGPEGGGITKNGFNIQGTGVNKSPVVATNDLGDMQKIVDFANGKIPLSTDDLAKVVNNGLQLSDDYGISVANKPQQGLVDQINSAIQKSKSVNRMSTPDQLPLADLENAAKNMANSFQPIIADNGHLPLDFSNSPFRFDKPAQDNINAVWQGLGQQVKQDPSLTGLDGMKQAFQAMADNAKQGSKEQALYSQMADSVRSGLVDQSPTYAAAQKAYQGYSAGKKMSTLLPNLKSIGTGGGLIAGGAAIAHPAALGAAVLGSPLIDAGVTRTVGSAGRNIIQPSIDLARSGASTSQAVTALLKALGAIK